MWEMYIPSDLGYGDRGSPPKIGGGDTLIFKMELIKIKGNKVPANRCDVTTHEGCDEREIKYIKKRADKSAADNTKELARLKKMAAKKMKPSLQGWVNQRLNIVTKLVAAKEEL